MKLLLTSYSPLWHGKSKFTVILGTLAGAYYKAYIVFEANKASAALSRSPFKYLIALQSLKCRQSTHAAGPSWWPMCIVDYITRSIYI